ncbi:SAM-dependent methyltransferase [Oerskovia sp. M15]
MVTFDHRATGTTEEAWRASGVLDRLPALDLAGPVDHLVLLAAHPDDETLGAAGLLARLSRQGCGSRSSSRPTARARTQIPRRTPCGARDDPAQGAPGSGRRGCTRSRRALPGAPGRRPARAPRVLHRQLAQVLEPPVGDDTGGGAAGRTLVCAPWRGDGHRDHRISGEVAAEVAEAHGARLLEYPIWWWHWGDPDDPRSTSEEVAMRSRAHPGGAGRQVPCRRRPPVAGRTALRGPRDAAVVGSEMLRRSERELEVFVEATPQDGVEDGTVAPAVPQSLPATFFDDFYRDRSDPWGFETRWYEQRKRALTLASLPRPRFLAGLEIGCSTGVLTAELAARCDRVVGVDVAEAPLAIARRRLGDSAELLRLETPRQWPAGRFDLVVLSEVGYYYGAADLETAIDKAVGSLTDDGVLVACHWRHAVPEHPLRGDEVHAALSGRAELARLARHLEEDFVLDVFVRPPARSVAAEAGLA